MNWLAAGTETFVYAAGVATRCPAWLSFAPGFGTRNRLGKRNIGGTPKATLPQDCHNLCTISTGGCLILETVGSYLFIVVAVDPFDAAGKR